MWLAIFLLPRPSGVIRPTVLVPVLLRKTGQILCPLLASECLHAEGRGANVESAQMHNAWVDYYSVVSLSVLLLDLSLLWFATRNHSLKLTDSLISDQWAQATLWRSPQIFPPKTRLVSMSIAQVPDQHWLSFLFPVWVSWKLDNTREQI